MNARISLLALVAVAATLLAGGRHAWADTPAGESPAFDSGDLFGTPPLEPGLRVGDFAEAPVAGDPAAGDFVADDLGADAVAIPEPVGVVLLAAGMGAMMLMRRRLG